MTKLKRGFNKDVDKDKKMIIIDQEKCKPKTPVFDYLVAKSKICNKECIIVNNNKINISDNCCMMCFNLTKRAPGDAIKIVKLPTNLETNISHCYGKNLFKLHGLPFPQPGSVLGLLGANGIGKSTALNILSGNIIPNFGDVSDKEVTKKEIINYYRGCELQNYFNSLYNKKLKISIKPQEITGFSDKNKGRKVSELLRNNNETNKLKELSDKLELNHLYERYVENLSGGELQRLLVAITILKNADVYFFDECSSFLDVKQRIIVTNLIRDIVDSPFSNDCKKKYVIVIEHDLAILDYMSDYIQSIYGKPGAYGVITSKSSTSNGINQYMDGYIKSENIKFRQYELSFKNNANQSEIEVKKKIESNYEEMNLNYGDNKFSLNVEKGKFYNSEIISLMGENGCGKSTFISLLKNKLIENNILSSSGISFKPQYINYKNINCTVQEFLEKEINSSLGNRNFRLIVLNPLRINAIKDLRVNDLSGGQIQRLCITICLGKPASIYLIDEPSAGLDCEQRVIVAKVIQKWNDEKSLERTKLLRPNLFDNE